MVGRTVVLLFLFILPFKGFSQEFPVFYAGTDIYYYSGLTSNVYGNLNVGSQVIKLGFFAPEVGYSTFFGAYPEREIKEGDPNYGYPDAIYRQKFTSSVLTLAPKLKFGREDAFLVFIPKYHIGTVKTGASYYVNDNDDGSFPLVESQQIRTATSYWSFALGFEGINISDKSWFSLTLNYSNLNAGEFAESLDFSEYDIKSKRGNTKTIGFGVRFYLAPFRSEND